MTCCLRFCIAVLLGLGCVRAAEAQTNAPNAPPPPPGTVTPVAYLRYLLMLPADSRNDVLRQRNSAERTEWLQRVEAYQSMDRGERERKLRTTELLYLLRLPPAERRTMLDQVPTEYRDDFHRRLEWWDQLPANVRAETNAIINYVLQFDDREGLAGSQATPAAPGASVEALIAKWQSIPRARRERISADLRRFLELPEAKQTLVLDGYSDPARAQIAATLKVFEKLSPPQRAAAIQSVDRLAKMETKELDETFKNAERWQEMSPAERASWKSVIQILPEGLPPLPGTTPPLPGPLVPALPAGATNSSNHTPAPLP